jgi:tocopherol cyclase
MTITSPTLFHPERYHGHRRRAPFFEGWYYKLVDATRTARFAVIPGIFLSDDPDRHHAFVQVLDGSTGEATYHRYPAESFRAARGSLRVKVGPNTFSDRGIRLAIDDEQRTMIGEVRFGELQPWPVSVTSLGIMGPYGYIPRMECNHGVVSLDHGLDGHLDVDGTGIDLAGGRGYIEKDWGAAFPAGYVWMQSNHFGQPGTSFVASIAIIPWLRSAFPGFIIGLWHEGRLHRFATYTGARTTHLHLDDDEVRWTVRRRDRELQIRARRAQGGLLYGPTREDMSDRVGETMRSSVQVRLTEGDRLVFQGTGECAGLELHGDLDRLLALQVD